MKILIACEFSGIVRRAFRKRGHDAWSCDLLPAEDGSEYHIQGDVLSVLDDGWDMMLAFPPCTYLCSSGLHWNKRRPERAKKTEEALEFVRALLNAPIDNIALENPIGCISTRIRKPDQVIQPYQFGHDASKATCLWLKNLPVLKPTEFVPPRYVCKCGHSFSYDLGKYGCPNCCGENGAARPRWANQTDSGQNRLGPSDDRWKERSKTYPGIAKAMAEQWG
ncbi:MAG: hypothetical protein D6816_17100 [Bacteroidetes bacterium]|nr:MAG: hypothetical protein D6816_17100 [Bacteroidota bacterium]